MDKTDSQQSKIHILSKELIAKIAAGEVVENPSSVVKELIENSIDAKSTYIEIQIEEAGTKSITIIDNGQGMTKEDAHKAFLQHSTSKISSTSDLENIMTLGFRGEALSSIAAVSDVILETNNGHQSTKIALIDSKEKITIGQNPKGTTISVKDLFKRIPARKKFLRSFNTEYKHILDIFLRHAIANPQIEFILKNNGKTVYNLPKSDELKIRIHDIWGKKISGQISPITFKSKDIELDGAIGHPQIARKDKSMQFVMLNSRPINSSLISKAVTDAFHAAKPPEYQPIFFLNLKIDPANVDVNVHPRKMEVKFANTSQIYQIVKQSAEFALKKSMESELDKYINEEHEQIQKPTNNTLKERILEYNPKRVSGTKFSKGRTWDNLSKTTIQQSLNFSKTLLETSNFPQKEEESESKPSLHKAFQIFSTYIVIEKKETLLFIDQHAGDERVRYEKLMRSYKNGNIATQEVMLENVIELDKREAAIIFELKHHLNKLGFKFENFGPNTIKVTTIPVIMSKINIESVFKEILNLDLPETKSIESIIHLIIATMACHSSIRAGRTMHPEEIQKLVQDLFDCEKPYSCPHGRPIIWEMPKKMLEKEFKRTGFC